MLAFALRTERLAELQRKASDAGMAGETALVGARAAANFTKDYLFSLDESQPNRLGGARTHFYSQAAKSVENPTQSGAGDVAFNINKAGLAQRWLGGTIRAGAGTSSATGGPTKYLALPARAEAHGKTPGEFDDLEFVRRKNGAAMLVQAMQTQITRGKRKGDFSTTTVGGLVMFWLVKEVDQDPDPEVMPSETALAGAAADAMDEYLAYKLRSQ